MNFWLFVLSFLLGLALTWLWVVRSVIREVFVDRRVDRPEGRGPDPRSARTT